MRRIRARKISCLSCLSRQTDRFKPRRNEGRARRPSHPPPVPGPASRTGTPSGQQQGDPSPTALSSFLTRTQRAPCARRARVSARRMHAHVADAGLRRCLRSSRFSFCQWVASPRSLHSTRTPPSGPFRSLLCVRPSRRVIFYTQELPTPPFHRKPSLSKELLCPRS